MEHLTEVFLFAHNRQMTGLIGDLVILWLSSYALLADLPVNLHSYQRLLALSSYSEASGSHSQHPAQTHGF